MGSCLAGGNWFIAVSASRASVVIQFLGLKLQLYLKPFGGYLHTFRQKKLDHRKQVHDTIQTTTNPHKFHPRVINNTNIAFSKKMN